MIKTIAAFAWLRDLAIVLLLVAGPDLRTSMPRVAVLMMTCAAVIFIERALRSWYLCELRDQKTLPKHPDLTTVTRRGPGAEASIVDGTSRSSVSRQHPPIASTKLRVIIRV